VLAVEVVELLDPQPGSVVLDCTAGRGGHGALLIPRLGPGGRYIGLDVDPGNVAYSLERLGPIAKEAGVELEIEHANFRDARWVLERRGLLGVDGVLADLGFASNQMDDPGRGLSFSGDGPLDMRMDTGATVTAERLVNTLPEGELADLIYEFGEERLSRRIARKIVEQRQREPITTTSGLAELVRRAYPRPRSSAAARSKGSGKSRGRGRRIDPATRTFMALRIAVNDELGALDSLLADLPGLLKAGELEPGGLKPGAPNTGEPYPGAGGRAAIISFHSLEDRRVKRAFAGLGLGAGFEVLTRKPVTASEEESRENPRSRSAKMRGIQRTG
jgi:16S rRNA (cytosine1402-N4)-methyltransferase